MEIVLLFVRLILAAIFTIAGIGKLLDLEGANKAVKDFGVPQFLARPLSFFLPLFELTIAGSFIFVGSSWFGAIGATFLLSLFIVAMVFQLAQGKAPDCHCFGQLHSEPVSSKSILRNILFLIGPAILLAVGKENQGIDLFGRNPAFSENSNIMQFIVGLAIVGLMAAIIYYLRQISGQQVMLLRRMDVLELLSHEGRDFHKEIGHPDDGLPVGAPAPDFSLSDIDGKLVEFGHLLARKKAILFFFVGPNCDPCSALLPEIENWAIDLQNRFEIVFVSSGKPQENARKFTINSAATILLQKDREVATLFGAVWTPTALVVNFDGTIGSRIATGDKAIRDLIESINVAESVDNNYFIANGNGELRRSKIGEKVPDFKIKALNGQKIGADYLYGKKTLVAFWSMTCSHCVNMLDDLRDWERQRNLDEPNLMLFSDGAIDDHKMLDLNSPVLIEKGYKTAIELGMVGTPSAVLVNEHGVIVSETAVGVPQIWALIGKRK